MNRFNTWDELFSSEEFKGTISEINDFLDEIYKVKTVYPERKNVFKAFELCPLDKVKVIILGQDPYHEKGQAHGLAFSVPTGVKLPPSLVNIFKEIENDTGTNMIRNGDLTYLAKQGVLLLNTNLTVEEGKPLSHSFYFYRDFISKVMSYLDSLDAPLVYILWGKSAQKFAKPLQNPRQLVLMASHPSPLSANRGGFFNTHLFSKCNDFLIKNHETPINWSNSN